MKNEFFNPEEFPYEVLGFQEEFTDGDSYQFLGSRKLDFPTRLVGSPGRLYSVLTEPLELVKGYKNSPVTIKASRSNPKKVISIIQVICGAPKELIIKE